VGDHAVSVTGLLLLSSLLVAGGMAPGALAPFEACSQGSRTSGECPSITSTVDSGGVSVGATVSTTGSPGSQTTTTGSSDSSPRLPWSAPPVRNPVLGSPQCTVIIGGSCRGQSPPKNPPGAALTTVDGPIAPTSLSDVASFSPRAPGIIVEPGAWSLPRLTTNIIAVAGAEIQRGELLGWPIEVRFSPQTYRWNYGDGSRATHSVAGGSWGQAQFSSTPTGHVYRSPGRYSITVEVDYGVAYRFGDGAFVPLSGVVRMGGGPVGVTVLRVTPVLVDGGCAGKALVGGRCE
jgi:hypothetical protein